MARRGHVLCAGFIALAGLTTSLVGLPSAAATAKPATSPCVLSAQLVPTCGVMLGAYPTSFGGGSSVADRFDKFNQDSGTTLSVGHDYRRPGEKLDKADKAIARTPGALLLVNWRPTFVWAQADGGDATINAQIDAMAHSVKKVRHHTIMMVLYHEPEKAVSGGADGCPSNIYQGSQGTPEQYREMWANVENRFAALHVTNVVWALDFVGYPTWDCMIDDLWPGNSLVDWILWDPYMTNSRDFSESVGSLYYTLTSLSDAQHDYLSKPWGLGEFGDLSSSDATQNQFYSTVKESLDTNEFPKLKLLTLYDAVGHSGDARVAFDASHHYDPAEVANLDVLGQDPLIVEGREAVDAH
jgi:hypothetical protein